MVIEEKDDEDSRSMGSVSSNGKNSALESDVVASPVEPDKSPEKKPAPVKGKANDVKVTKAKKGMTDKTS